MIKRQSWFTAILITMFTAVAISGCGEQEPPGNQHSDDIGNRKSPIAIASVKSNSTYIKVVYGQPYRRGRVIFGDLLPWGEVWRTGANEATEITLTNQVLMDTEAIRPGTYSLFTIPEQDSMTIILNHELGQWGAMEYNSARDYKRFKVPVQTLDVPVEAFAIGFTEPEFSQTTMQLRWGLLQADVPIRFYGE